MKRFFLSTTLALALSGTLAFAQQDAAPPQPTPQHQHVHNPQRETAHLSKRLNLSSDQSAKLEPILASRDQKIDALKSNTAMTPQDFKQQMRAIHKDTMQQMATVLTPDQMQQLRAERHHGHGAPNQAQPQAPQQPGL